MKLLRASFQNFRLLKEIDIEFSADADRNITVIRAANESGKTTMLTALQWGLFGDIALPNRGQEYRLHPLDTPTARGTRVEISVTIDYEVNSKQGPKQYRIIRSAIEEVAGETWERQNTALRLYRLTREGADPLDNPEVHIHSHMPLELREVFFTDGDRALSFIQGSRGEQMKRVEGAIRSLLGLSVVEEAQKHVRQVGADLNKRVKTETGLKNELSAISSRISAIGEELPNLENELQQAMAEALRLEDLERAADRQLTEALRNGNRDELAKERERVRLAWRQAENDTKQAGRDHANLFKSQSLARQLLVSAIKKSKGILDGLHDRGKIPNQTIPVLEERLTQTACICGESLNANDPGGQKRREHIMQLIEASRGADVVQELVTALFYSSKELLSPVEGQGWLDEYSQVFERRQSAASRLSDLGTREREIDAKINSLPDINIIQLRESRDLYRQKRDKAFGDQMGRKASIENRRDELKTLQGTLEKLLNKDEKGLMLLAELEVARDLQTIIEAALEAMKTREISKVSQQTNTLFLDMIGADASQRSIIQRAELTSDFRIIVYGQNDRQLDPSQDLNGASRRALTVAFILALTKVSEVEAPNVIDTPLGMMSGYVKRTVLRRAADESSQLILFLTHDEIKGCEDILDEKAGRVYTMTNPAHYPRILVHDPHTADTRVLVCSCNHRKHCVLCERKKDADMKRHIAELR